jgi:hypothetical protein
MNSETSVWPDGPLTFSELCKERTKFYESKFRGVLLTYYGPARAWGSVVKALRY